VLLTVLGEFVLPSGGTATTSTLIDSLRQLGVEAPTVRQALARTAKAGLLSSSRDGRQASWTLTDRGTRLLTDGTDRIYRFGLDRPEWDGRWLLVMVTVPETNRHLRYRLRLRLAWDGFALIAPGVWMSPWVDREVEAKAALEDLGLEGGVLSFVGQPGALGPLEDRVSAAWDLAEVAAEYDAFVRATEAKSAQPSDDAACFADLVSLVHDWRHFPGADPGLPAQLLPDPWAGRAAARLFHERHDRWRHGAWRWWQAHGGGSPS
jgi:phenylacetic acid degradation operon negative regulatory protein